MSVQSWLVRTGIVGTLLAVRCAVGAQGSPTACASGSVPFEEHRKIMEVKADLHAAMREEATATDARDRAGAVRRLVGLFNEIVTHPQAASPPFRRASLRVQGRLARIKRSLVASQERPPPQVSPAAAPQARTVTGVHRTLAQQVGDGGGLNAGGAPAAVSATAVDFGAELVTLIEKTLQSDVWTSQGGPAAIVYYQPLHALVIRAPTSLHEDVGALLGALRAAGP